ncbi:DUF3630 family protein [Photobacterium damselae subsp. piscicida]|uniref:DUF3630 family protein n=1 Tax=Photobacterium damsela subsp. piscicida TaxID=38294 RepID=A0A5F0YP88_PHODP|nr:DUF3630 family protein [Photobacterium damselae]MBE8130430.1 DUF3630 family protein [Photobacterium damselae subsp. piscicida]PSV78541.1 DUF3630 domain-containing protein [Photobacterium damselae]PSW82014.1 DUF3630 domain-containing protein [Photobacterium damselae]QOD54072.1 DUF3630 family protein [Photobacterium damselae subsp. piscicida]QOD57918.1 DUF3630 family protein [Photobacterium damselae subsp. piscicida]
MFAKSQPLVIRKSYSFIIPNFDFDRFAVYGEQIAALLDCRILEREINADLQIWLLDFEGCHLLLKGEYYSQSIWLEALDDLGEENLVFIARLFRSKID